ncbi:NAD-dependent succinate-semialdehyde dehydrogenase [Paenibacillus glucanolyticus]|jgi:succinate-semialdehyde dehydrogenase/glutarate-semialdehyde dehydrogenase|uniref:NAD-dependent succinate-semialdehyde dehydrogenase n=1 Tax=Paenibacillus TaxID=44249 RepID=UPI0003E1EA9E|nr:MULTISPECIES: NAD-dependent succinate-semialdehyde dehydrogenase [Paenibacillus]ANA83267.1 succinate-semialdehyde dehydrogenase (NADP(+)) [Paenibacillus glucanolyticus]AVV57642.1 NAD-dependent succinate-semialdehyde dehydrogenase [Paenibacillus glucanolyticus]ETT34410.1 succinic semialdehyde dehydrogenase [Paenibacillus sp. FSL R5-808]
MYRNQIYIDGQWVQTEEQMDVYNPADGKVIGTVPKGGKREAQQAVDAAAAAFSDWSGRTANDRGELLRRWHQLIADHTDELARIMTTEQGKPLKEAAGEIRYANSFVDWYAEEGKRIYGETIPGSSSRQRIIVTKQPVGVVAAITPWNFPASMITRKVAPALAAGCTVVIKPSGETPFTAIKLVELADEAGIPAGVINIVTGPSGDIADVWQKDSRVRKLSFTGSTEVGKQLMAGAAANVKKISLELGGHAPFIVTDQADLDQAAAGLISSKFRNGGQTCVCANRIYVQESVAEKFAAKFTELVKQLRVGNGLENGIDIGPLINEEAVDKVVRQIKDAEEKGGVILAGGQALPDLGGNYVEPTVIMNATDDMECMNEETFGPLAPITTFKTIDEAVKRANNSPYGLAAYVFTQNLGEAVKIAESLDYGIVGVNDPVPSTAQAPFGGFKESGLGREGGHYGMEEFLEVKYISLGL